MSNDIIIKRANEICQHTFDLLGSGPKNLGKDINWHQDFKTGKIWSWWLPQRFIRYKFDKGFDIKVPWELSRFYHLPILAQAYVLIDEGKYLKEIEVQISDWIRNNPVGFGLNWKCTMEVAIRVCNWIKAWQMLKSSNFKLQSSNLEFKIKNFEKLFLKSLKRHGKFIYSHLEPGHTNHYLSNIVGLIYLGILGPEFKEARKWREFGINALEEEMKKQVNPDGCDFESSIPYHRLVLELFSYSALLCKQHNIELSDYFWQKLRKMFDFVSFYTKPDGLAPQVGDNDNGQLHKYQMLAPHHPSPAPEPRTKASFIRGRQVRCGMDSARIGAGSNIQYPINNHRYLFDLAKEIWPDYQKPIATSKDFPQSGYYIIRDKENYMVISAGKVGTEGIGNHKHNDIFSFELCSGRETFIVDPGTYLYTSDRKSRNLFRSTAYHNTVRVDGREINEMHNNELFGMPERAYPKVLKWESNKDQDVFEAEHYGYKPTIHRRRIIFDKKRGSWKIYDSLLGTGQHLLEIFFHLASGIKPGIKKDHIELVGRKNNLSLTLAKGPKLKCEIINGFVSPSYGLKQEAQIIKFEGKLKLPLNIQFLIQ